MIPSAVSRAAAVWKSAEVFTARSLGFLQWELRLNVGSLYLVASSHGISGVLWKGFHEEAERIEDLSVDTRPAARLIAQAAAQIEEYFQGARKEFDLPLDLRGTAFQRRVWAELRKIPYGTTCSYRDVANRIGDIRAVRAVGGANGKNPVSILVPCHRVIASDGSLGGYGGGAAWKTRLLGIEGVRI